MSIMSRVFGINEIKLDREPVIQIPMTAKVQTTPAGEYPWRDECAAQIAAMGDRALATRQLKKRLSHPSVAQILNAAQMLRDLVADAEPPIEFQARRPSRGALFEAPPRGPMQHIPQPSRYSEMDD